MVTVAAPPQRAPHPRRAASLRDRIAIAPGLGVSPVCLGWVGEPSLIADAFELGINFFFVTADMHWPLYEACRTGLSALLARVPRHEVVVAVVSYVTQPEFCHAPFRELIRAVHGLESIDLTVMGGTYAGDVIQRKHQFELHRQPGPRQVPGARALGATFHDRTAALHAANHGLVDLVFLRYNPDHPGAEHDVFPHLRPDSSVLFNFNSIRGYLDDARWAELGLGSRRWRPRATDYYRYALRIPEVSGVLAAARSRADLEQIAAAFSEPPLDQARAAYLVQLADLAAGRAQLDEPEDRNP